MMMEKCKNTLVLSPSVRRTYDVKCRQIATCFSGSCKAKFVKNNDAECVIFKLKMPGLDDVVTPPIPLNHALNPDPIEYFVKELYSKPSKYLQES